MSKGSVVDLSLATDSSIFGGKASNLAKLIVNKIPVPDGLAIGITAFSATGELQPTSKSAIKNWLNIQSKKEKYAVRSSALNEDGQEQSWAGQFDTYLNVIKDGVIKKTAACHNATSSRAKAYAGTKDSGTDFEVAVVIQKMIQPDYAGVLFTRNPVNDSNQIVIEYMAGLAEQLVSGEVTPESCVWDRDKKQMSMNYTPPFDVDELVKLALSIEEIYSHPQDIEWVVRSNRFSIVQARPITTLGGSMLG